MSSTYSVIDMVTRESLRLAHEKLSFIGTVNRNYDDSYAKTGAKIGDTLRVRNPNAYVRRQGSRVMNVQDTTETTQSITVATQDGVDMKFNSAELTLNIDELSKRYIEPAVNVLVAGIEGDMLAAVTKDVYNVTGTAGTVVGTSGDISALTDARAKLNQCLAPKADRSVQIDSVTMGTVVNGTKALFHDGTQIKEAFREGHIARNAMADWYENEKTYVHTNIADVTGTTDSTGLGTAESDGGYTLLDMHTTVVSPAVGTVFTIAGVYAVHPETKRSYQNLQQFTITATSASSFCSVSPKIYLSGPRQNVASAASAALTTTTFNSATLTFHGAGSSVLRHNLMYHKDAFTFVTADLPLMDDALKCVRRVQDGLSIRVWQGSDIRNDELLLRLDILYGWKTLRPEWACRISN
jgi:hypothetical protein